MENNNGYEITRAVVFDNSRGFALGHDPAAPSPFVTWQFTEEQGKRDYYWGHYFNSEKAATTDFHTRAADYKQQYGVHEVQTEGPEVFKYYSTQRPLGPGTFPRLQDNPPVEIINYDVRRPVEDGAFRAWGELIFDKPLTEREAADYELRPSPQNPDLRKRIAEQAQIVGKWEDEEKRPEWQRITQWDADQGAYAALDTTPPEQLSYCVRLIEAQRAAHKRQPPIAEQLKEAGRLAQENRGKPAPKKDAPDRGDR